ncbi:alpha/beta hydrolase [Pseudovibrio sp. SPO723]|uniref:alpha/beta hydrolase n=1 Tax=Nesiotobacter zosterae TaxID=392721 RepID=UPI0029C5CDA6|nr:alpha/beta hydrolase [Pseudovibrio sp. SPO723]MDX5594679.1 alpha/beta hydrolase [Pseudovibrio sp. SPO723]
MRLARLALAGVLTTLATSALAFSLGPYKDPLFAYPGILDQSADGSLVVVDYQIERDLRGRDQVPERRVKSDYVSHKPSWSERDTSVTVNGQRLAHIRVGKPSAETRVITLYLHGKGGNRHQGANDNTFGGNFNRIKNLMIRNDGVYISPDFNGFEQQGLNEIAGLIATYKAEAPNASVFVACGSMGSLLCYRLAQSPDTASLVDGLLFLGGATDETLLTSAAVKRRVPIFFGHGSEDRVYDWTRQHALFLKVKKLPGAYPVRFALFQSGSHGTPIRMLDWRRTLNWMLANPPG